MSGKKERRQDIARPPRKLGFDLPNSEDALFHLGHYPLFDMELGADILGSENVVKTILASFDKDIKYDLEKIKENIKKELGRDSEIIHKTKSSAEFGTVRLYFALLFMERYLKAGHSNYQEALYDQMLKIMGETFNKLRNRGIIQ